MVLELPRDLPPGRYRLLVGLYEDASGLRLPVFDASGQSVGDSLSLELIPVQPVD